MQARAAIYLDSNASAPLKPQVSAALSAYFIPASKTTPVLTPNPSSIHMHGREAKRILADAREKIAYSIGGSTVDPEQLVFTSSGSEANQLAIRSVLEKKMADTGKAHWILTAVEHDSVLQLQKWFESRGGRVSVLPVNSEGLSRIEALAETISADTALISSVWVNNETGVITPLAEISRLAHDHGIPLHVDAAQAWGKLEVDVTKLGAQLVTFSAHKIGALAGTGALWLARKTTVQSVIFGKQEKGRRGGTENLVGIMAAGVAAENLTPMDWAMKVRPLRDQLEREILARIEGAHINGSGSERVANTLNLSFDGVVGDGLIMALDLEGYSVSSGSACASGVLEPSHVLMAMGQSREQAMSATRVSLSEINTWNELEGFVAALSRAVERARAAKKNFGLTPHLGRLGETQKM